MWWTECRLTIGAPRICLVDVHEIVWSSAEVRNMCGDLIEGYVRGVLYDSGNVSRESYSVEYM
jgi:hypothetical protein